MSKKKLNYNQKRNRGTKQLLSFILSKVEEDYKQLKEDGTIDLITRYTEYLLYVRDTQNKSGIEEMSFVDVPQFFDILEQLLSFGDTNGLSDMKKMIKCLLQSCN
jgi:hypothetical protein